MRTLDNIVVELSGDRVTISLPPVLGSDLQPYMVLDVAVALRLADALRLVARGVLIAPAPLAAFRAPTQGVPSVALPVVVSYEGYVVALEYIGSDLIIEHTHGMFTWPRALPLNVGDAISVGMDRYNHVIAVVIAGETYQRAGGQS